VSGESVDDISGKTRTFTVIPPVTKGDYTRHYLDDARTSSKIEVFVLEKYLKEKLNIAFNPRTVNDIE